MAAVNAIFLRMSATWKALRIVESMAWDSRTGARALARGPRWPIARADSSGCPLARRAAPARGSALDELAGAPRGLDALARAGAERVGVDGQRLAQLSSGEHLHRHARPGPQAARAQEIQRDLGARVEAAVERGDVHGLRAGAERLERHRLLHVGPAQLSHARVDRHLTALQTNPPLGARARAGTLLAASRGLARARALAAAHALARTPAPRRGGQIVQADALGLGGIRAGHLASLTSTRWRTAWSIPRACSQSRICTLCPMRRRPSERSVSRCLRL